MLAAIAIMSAISLALGGALGFVARKWTVRLDPVAEAIDALLPQTQCGKCGYPGCKPYAQAIAAREAEINRCPPGGDELVRSLSEMLGMDYKPLDRLHGAPKPKSVAVVNEALCIGCALCLEACPVDAIVGAARQMHTVISAQCTGCELCIARCPVDCIDMVPPGGAASRGSRHLPAAQAH
jgi:electron transport complex protein RnfB